LAEIDFVGKSASVYRGTMDGSASYQKIYNIEYGYDKQIYHNTAQSLSPYLSYFHLRLISVPGVVAKSCV
jgi:hypothetical protein